MRFALPNGPTKALDKELFDNGNPHENFNGNDQREC